ncbi:MAG: DNRLRE domain-containing protein [Opitutaceae bacterium]|jgi:hypothetical protein|nr:DNRLRE domain-containing protein [Opitutaceae bacterium]
MKNKLHIIIRINTALAAFSMATALHAATTPTAPTITFTAYDQAANGITGEADGSSDTGDNISVGELDDTNANRLDRAILVFTLPALPEGETLVSAKLQIHVRSVSTATPDALLYHSRSSEVTSNYSGLYSAGSYTSTGLSVATSTMTASTSEPRLVTLDVTAWVKTDYQLDTGTVISSFRIQVDGQDFLEDNINHRYTFFGKNSEAYAPRLIIETQAPAIPEPGHLGLLIGGVSLTLIAFRPGYGQSRSHLR